ncbi:MULTISPECIES: hypothetical protein [unclassified Achromobacter]|uniref:hypothetical protein n=1 Tax=unclassified Achromobacter TaxID=2626865 RepID=UPI00069E38BF|nr:MULTISPECIES: hypothetical protein [unclassified Achromobacter]KOF52766.1 hypothetical protein AD428_18115 [Achromobacter sp. DMS1]
MEPKEELQTAADALTRARRRFARGEEGLRLLRQSREAFINSLRNTGLTYSEAKTKYDNCLEEQEAEQARVLEDLRYAERVYQYVVARIAQPAGQD